LLDWTESATVALFFACERKEGDGVVFLFNPINLNRLSHPKKPRILDANLDGDEIDAYLKLDATYRRSAKTPIAINPVSNSERLILQKGVFTLHGSRFDLSGDIPSLVGLPILSESKPNSPWRNRAFLSNAAGSGDSGGSACGGAWMAKTKPRRDQRAPGSGGNAKRALKAAKKADS